MEEKKKFKISDIWAFLKNALVAIVKGEFLLRLNLDKIFPQIAYTFFLIFMIILFSLMVDSTLGRVEQNKKTLSELEMLNAQKTFELVTLDRRSTISTLLEEQGSPVAEPQKPAKVLK